MAKLPSILLALLCVGIAPADEKKKPADEKKKVPLAVGIVVEDYNKKRMDGITRLNKMYIDKLEAVKAKFMKGGDLDSANAAVSEIAKLQAEIDSLTIGSPVYSDKHDGVAGLPKHTKNHIYKFKVSRFAENAKLVLNAKAHGGTDSKGEIIWKIPNDPEGRKIGEWSGSTKYPLVIELPKGCRATGNYAVVFEYKSGDNPLHIYSAELHTE